MAIKLYWCRGKGREDPAHRNFGDYLSPLIVEMAARKSVEYAPIYRADLMAIGSILGREAKAKRFLMSRRMHVWGSGTDAPGKVFSGRHYYHAVRGAKTREQIAGRDNADTVFGDPGLLASQWWEGRYRPEKRYTLGFIPHYTDQGAGVVEYMSKQPNVKVIDVFWPVDEVLRTIQQCHFVISSSLHGLIVADAFGVPNRRVVIASGKISDYKFVDYYSAFGLDEPPKLVADELMTGTAAGWDWLADNYARPGMDRLQAGLLASFPQL